MKYQAVVFDLDGTLTDSCTGIMRCAAFALEKMRRPPLADATLRRFLGPPLSQSFAQYAGMTREETIRATDLYRERYAEIGWRENRVFPGIRALLQALRAQGAYLAVATGKLAEASVRILEYFDLARYFDRIVGPAAHEYDITKRELILRALSGRNEDAVMVGDRDSDLDGAREARIEGIGVLYGYGAHEELAKTQPAALVNDVAGLFDVLGVQRAPARPFFLTLEGNDGVGKTTQARALHERLTDSGYDVRMTREPGGSRIAEAIRGMLLSTQNTDMSAHAEALLYAAARAQHVQDVIRPALLSGQIVLCDRYVDSSIAYQGAGRELGEDRVADINRFAIDGVMPDLTVLLAMDPLVALRRREQSTGSDRMERLDNAFHQRVEQAFLNMPKADPARVVKVDAAGTPQAVAERVYQVVRERLQAAGIA